MSDPLEKAKRLAAAGKYRAAVDSLRYAEPIARAGDLTEVRAILELVAAIRDHADRRLQQECDEIADSMRDVLDRESGPGVELSERAMVFLSGCLVIGGAGLHVGPDTNRQWNLAFTKDRVVLLPCRRPESEEVFDIGWEGLHVEIEGAGEIRQGGGFIGGGFGLEGAAVGMVAATALNALTTTTSVDTVLHLQTRTVKLYLFYGLETPEVLRRTMSPVFLRLRQAEAAGAPSQDAGREGHVVDRVHKLADLLDRGLIDEDEFARLKADLMGQVP